MRIAIPSRSSKLHHPALSILKKHFNISGDPFNERCLHCSQDRHELVFCRGSDIPSLVGIGVVDLGLAGYDMAVETHCQTGQALDIRHFGQIRPSFVCYATLKSSKVTHIARIYSEYEQLTRRWAAKTLDLKQVPIVPLHGSSEGIIATDQYSAAVLLVTTGETLRANGDFRFQPLLATDICLIAQPENLATMLDDEFIQQLTKLPCSPALVNHSTIC